MQNAFQENDLPEREPETEEYLLDQPASRSVERGAAWVYEAFLLLREYWAAWAVIAAVLYVGEVVGLWLVTYTAGIGAAVYAMFMLFKAGGIAMAASAQEYEERPPRISDLFMIFDNKIFDFVFLLFLMAVFAGIWALLLFAIASTLLPGLTASPIAFALLLAFWLVSVQMLLGFAPILLFLQDENPPNAILSSIKTTAANILPIMLNGLIFVVITMPLMLLSAKLDGIASLVITAMLLAVNILSYLSTYAAYRDIWFEEGVRDEVTVGYR
ncbi:Uncharacterised protein [Kingella potus]|uniref:Uncharacterized protein n=1 Tax=Kingella potus TaxID=265175 RepID=A0A377R3E7_9NEIS|nr:hypothetical protein [Kingella potus]UOP00025.1 hypothetical protein LVJ84_08410 [Kingella potus]STR03317.1 Uncharacterised protein [Kingella potus]